MAIKICPCCGQPFQPHHKVPNQSYCSSPDCQQARRRQWERDKQKNDPDYRDNKSRSQRAWVDRNPNYWRTYRKSISGLSRGTSGQSDLTDSSVKMDDLASIKGIPAGIYRIRPVSAGDGKVNGKTWVVEITPMCPTCPCQDDDYQDRT
ncbi:MAG: hypothetical protein BWK72_12280 [Rhodoferax ferrireducens]|uniref:Uncharacterized protein n=1 Tax=Rhodoferax ferrireducens TaxID=192843 RepID=A0A1W9KTI1_9BURK|nr:MAG: hypothetical protein BWK72_12280 [Rhodoferax ferrireducens]